MIRHLNPIRHMLAVFLFAMVMIVHGNAATVTFDERGTFLAATSASAAGPIPAGPGLRGESSFTFNHLTFTSHAASSFFIDSNEPDFGIRIPGFDLVVNDVESFNIDFSTPVFSLGFDFHEPENDPNVNGSFVDSQFEITLLSGLSVVDSFTFTRPNDSLEFVGVWTSDSFDRIELRETTGGLENEFFGNFATGVTPIPEPSAASLVALIGFCLIAHRRRKT